MKEKLINNLGLKILSCFLAFVMWLVVVNVSNPEMTGSKEVPLEIVNEQVLTKAGRTYELGGKDTVTVYFDVRTKDAYKIHASDFHAYIDLAELYDVTGSVQVNIEVLNNKELISNAESRPGVVRIQTEELQSKQFSLIMNTYGSLAEDYAISKAILTPDHVTVEGPTSQVGLINHVGIELNVNGLESATEGAAKPIFYDANGNEITVSDRVSVSPESIQYTLEVSKVKTLPLDFEVTGTAASGYQYTGVECSVKNVSVMGLKNSLASVNKITIPSSVLNVAGATQDKIVTVDLNDYLPEDVSLANADDAKVTIRLKVEQLTTRTITLSESDISMENSVDYYHYHLSPSRIEVKLQGLKEDLDTLKAENLKASINLFGMQLGTHTGSLTLDGLGNNFKLISVSSFSVEVTAGGPAAQVEQSEEAEETTQADSGTANDHADNNTETTETSSAASAVQKEG